MLELQLIGNLGKDPELRYLPDGTEVCNFTVAVNNGKDADGNAKPPTWIRVTAWRQRAEWANKWLNKGDRIFIRGWPKTSHWQDDAGQSHCETEVDAREIQFAGKSKSEQT